MERSILVLPSIQMLRIGSILRVISVQQVPRRKFSIRKQPTHIATANFDGDKALPPMPISPFFVGDPPGSIEIAEYEKCTIYLRFDITEDQIIDLPMRIL
jgi:hypothetical protein